MSRYLWILADQRPAPMGENENEQERFTMNFSAKAAAPVDTWEEELGKLINQAGLGTFGTDMFKGRGFDVPAGAGPFIQIIDTGGTAPDETHDGALYEMLSAQVVVYAQDPAAGRTRALAIWRAVAPRRNQTVTA